LFKEFGQFAMIPADAAERPAMDLVNSPTAMPHLGLSPWSPPHEATAFKITFTALFTDSMVLEMSRAHLMESLSASDALLTSRQRVMEAMMYVAESIKSSTALAPSRAQYAMSAEAEAKKAHAISAKTFAIARNR
jgi:hypothetical protein